MARRLFSLLLALSFVVTSCAAGAETTPTEPAGFTDIELTDIETVEELAADFNDDAGSLRLILLLSPT